MATISNEERRRLDFFALETLVRCMLVAQFAINPETEDKLVDVFERATDAFRLTGADADKVPEFRDYMKQRGLQWIASASQRRPE